MQNDLGVGKGLADILEIVEAKVEVNDVPLGVAEPGLDSGDAVRGVGAVFGALAVLLHWPNNIGLALEHLLHEGGVADGDGIPEEENVGEFFFLGVKEGTAEERDE